MTKENLVVVMQIQGTVHTNYQPLRILLTIAEHGYKFGKIKGISVMNEASVITDE